MQVSGAKIPGIKCHVPGFRCQVHRLHLSSARSQVPGVRCQAPDFGCHVPGARDYIMCQVSGIKFHVKKPKKFTLKIFYVLKEIMNLFYAETEIENLQTHVLHFWPKT